MLKEYKRSLKEVEAEDTIDILLYRPLAFILVKAFYSLPITPNHYSFLSLTSGLFAAFYISKGTPYHFKWGALYFLLSSVLDNCDGMIARLKQNGTEFGRLIDGLVDYIVNIAVYLAMAIGLSKIYNITPGTLWTLVILAGISKGVHSISYDHYLNEYLSHKNGSNGFLVNEIKKIRDKVNASKNTKNSFVRIIALEIYLKYSQLQTGFQEVSRIYNSKDYCNKNLKLLKLWSLIGPTAHITVLIISFLLNIPFLLLGYALVVGNLWLIIMFTIQSKLNQTLSNAKNTI